MPSHSTINRVIVLGFMVLVGFSLAKSIYSGSIIGLLLAVTSLGAGVYFMYLLAKMNAERES